MVKSGISKQSGAVEACWAHNPEVRGSKPRSAKLSFAVIQVLKVFVFLVFIEIFCESSLFIHHGDHHNLFVCPW